MSLWADFADVYDSDLLVVSLDDSPPTLRVQPVPGDWVELYDESGNECIGQVQRVSGPLLWCQLKWSTWRQPPTRYFESITPFSYEPFVDSNVVAAVGT